MMIGNDDNDQQANQESDALPRQTTNPTKSEYVYKNPYYEKRDGVTTLTDMPMKKENYASKQSDPDGSSKIELI